MNDLSIAFAPIFLLGSSKLKPGQVTRRIPKMETAAARGSCVGQSYDIA